MHDAGVSKLIAASRGSPCDSMVSCFLDVADADSPNDFPFDDFDDPKIVHSIKNP